MYKFTRSLETVKRVNLFVFPGRGGVEPSNSNVLMVSLNNESRGRRELDE